jgi:serine/threonine-protein kinase
VKKELKPGSIFQKTYRIVRKLGEGSLGPVYLADDMFLNELRALRLLPRELNSDEALTARFRRELNALRQVSSKNVVSSSDLQHGEDETAFVAIEYVDGPGLRTLLDIAPGPFDVDLTLAIARSIAEGLVAAHACGLVHRDMKPKNILIAREGKSWTPKIGGLALAAVKENSAAIRATGETVLTPTYAASEQWYGTDPADLDGRTDLYALGGVLYEMLTGHTPFHATDYEGWAMQHIKAEPLPPSALRADLAERDGLDELILKLLAKDCEGRPRSAAEFLVLLDAVQFGIPAPQPVPQPVPQPSSAKAVDAEEKADPIPVVELPENPSQTAEEATSFTATSAEVGPVAGDATVPADEASAPIAVASSASSAIDTNWLAEDEPQSVSAPQPIVASAETGSAAEEEIALVAAAIPAPVETVIAAELERSSVAEEMSNLASDVPAGAVPAGAVTEEPINGAEPPAVSGSLDTNSATEVRTEKTQDFEIWLRRYARRDIPRKPEKPVEPQAVYETPGILRDTVEKPKEPAEWYNSFTSADRSHDAGEEGENSPESQNAAPDVETAVELTPEQKELAELQRLFTDAQAATNIEQKLGRTGKIRRLSAYSHAARDAEAALDNPAESEGSTFLAIAADEPVAAVSANTGEVPRILGGGSPAFKTDLHDEEVAAGETTSGRITHPAWKVMAAMVLLAAVGFAGWRFSYTDPQLPPANLASGCKAGNAAVCSQLAGWYEQTVTVKDGDAKAVTYYSKACDGSFPLACRKLGYKLLFGKGIPEDKRRAMALLAKACDQSDYESCDVLAEIYHNGEDVTKDDARAMQLYNRSCSLGEDFGCKWAARLDALNHPAPPVHRPRTLLASSTTSAHTPAQ